MAFSKYKEYAKPNLTRFSNWINSELKGNTYTMNTVYQYIKNEEINDTIIL